MDLEQLVKATEHLFNQLDLEIATFQEQSTLHCKFGCGKCCFKPDIEATILEFLPFAQHLYNDGKANEWYENLSLDKLA